MLAWLGTRIGRLISGALVVAAAILAVFTLGKREGRSQATQKRDKDYIKTRKEMDDAQIHGDDPAAARRWLHERKQRRDL